ncbi:glycosyltransferase [Sulfurovum sp.]|uniref:glycosyltransferase n=1 Tax=Sulfurovum sp. TaxID=1969726 RepID=UPI002867E92A|nr:glycosyltransferase [Sulfurovum sp.]
MKNISFFTKYTSQGATSRYRSFFFMRQMLNKDYNISIHSFLDSEYLENLYAKKPRKKSKIIIAYLSRFFSLFTASKNLIIENELFPYLPYWFEKLFLKKKQYVLNFDDNVWENYKDKFWLNTKYDKLVQHANGAIVANDFLFEKVKSLNSNIIKIPTAIDLEDYTDTTEKNKVFTLVWIGTPVTYRYIESHAEVFKELAKKIKYELCIVATEGLGSRAIDGVNMKFVEWSTENEVHYLKQAHIGIMPLDKDMFSQGKSSFKLIQYLAASIPLIGSAIGENSHVIQDGVNGFLVSTDEQWIEKIELLYQDKLLSEEIAINCQKDAYNYSIQKYFPLYKDFIDSTFEKQRIEL